MRKILFLIFLFSFLHAGEDLLPPHYRVDQKLSSEFSKGTKNLETKVYLLDDNMEAVLELLASKGISLRNNLEEKREERVSLKGLKSLKVSSDYRRYSGWREDGTFIIVASHYFDPDEKKWVKKTNLILIAQPSPKPTPQKARKR
ncbi:MAG: hypothetical protein HYT76_07830 [Deltaproteobacteria bacterium]|nr:hypothetical protein [Deltaproteobacteria bacterium]